MSTTVFSEMFVGVDIARSATNHLVTLVGTGCYQSDGVHSQRKKHTSLVFAVFLLTIIHDYTCILRLVSAIEYRLTFSAYYLDHNHQCISPQDDDLLSACQIVLNLVPFREIQGLPVY